MTRDKMRALLTRLRVYDSLKLSQRSAYADVSSHLFVRRNLVCHPLLLSYGSTTDHGTVGRHLWDLRGADCQHAREWI